MIAADEQLVAEQKLNNRLSQRGKKPYTFKTKFGVVKVPRIRVSAGQDANTCWKILAYSQANMYYRGIEGRCL